MYYLSWDMCYTVVCPDYLDWWLDSSLNLVQFTQYIHVVSSVSVALYMYYLNYLNSSECYSQNHGMYLVK